jgi:hypothetical protein
MSETSESECVEAPSEPASENSAIDAAVRPKKRARTAPAPTPAKRLARIAGSLAAQRRAVRRRAMDAALECVVELLERHETALLQRLEDAASDADGETSVFVSEIDEVTAAVLCRGGADVDGDVVNELFERCNFEIAITTTGGAPESEEADAGANGANGDGAMVPAAKRQLFVIFACDDGYESSE